MKLNLMFRDGATTQFMQHLDVFERFKVVAKPTMIATLETGRECGEVAEKVRAASVANGDGNTLIAAWNDSGVYYRDQDVKVISDGERFALLDDIIGSDQLTESAQ